MELLDSAIHASVNIMYGIGLAVIIAAVLLFVVFALKGGNSISPFCYLLAIILTPLLSLQFSLMFGAISAKQGVNDLADTINGYAQLIVWTDNGYSSMEDISDAIEEFQGFLPGLSADLGQLTLGKVDKNDIGGSLMGPSKSYLNKYILFRILWSIIFCAIAIVAMIVLSDGGGTSNYRRSHIRTERVSSRRSSDGRRPSRRTRRY